MEDREISDVVLEQVSGGLGKPQQMPGMKCPRCASWIAVSIRELLTSEYIVCPCCCLKLKIDRSKGAAATES